jgi:hypothetical protein
VLHKEGPETLGMGIDVEAELRKDRKLDVLRSYSKMMVVDVSVSYGLNEPVGTGINFSASIAKIFERRRDDLLASAILPRAGVPQKLRRRSYKGFTSDLSPNVRRTDGYGHDPTMCGKV